MAIVQGLCTSFKEQLLGGEHDLDTHTIKIALYTSSANLGVATTAYTTSNEVSGTGYSAGGATLGSPNITTDGTTAICDFADPSWTTATFTAAGALIYNDSVSDKAIAVLAFGGNFTVTAGTFTIVLPTANASNALIRLA